MNVIFLCFTPYHIKVSNWLSKTKFREYRRYIILSSFTCIEEDKLRCFLEQNLYNNIDYYHLNYKMSEVLKKPLLYIQKYRSDLSNFFKKVDKIDPVYIIYFSDNPIPYQILFNKLKTNEKKLVLVEEGTALYLNKYKSSLKEKLSFYIRKKIFKDKTARLFQYGKGNFEDIIMLREPELIDNRVQKIKITPEEYRQIFSTNKKDINKFINQGALFCPAYTTYNINIRNKVYNDIFRHYFNAKKDLCIKLHPAEKNTNYVKDLAAKYGPYVKFIDDFSITSEDIIIRSEINEIVSDTSSVLINAFYLKDNIRLISYINLLKDKYNINLNFNYSIYDKLYLDGKIENLNL
ncbi:polysialyltransferase family glycosyltransferase [Thermoanaerobacterium thermosaccharolyticum]|uniref:Glycosyl/glycerophosphate transferase, teichoic acid biosynthesis n=1 Tax=Thermoanaerobacterium thermosaccharolyticum M0795 TaxID=698948 RepID=L0IJW3_THETR|nr:polysialyltransferase family glycosyltransferase [Thermoanaerobacterium thermosaccharolyticum]AGB18531.1 hypothetical protein Thethe_00858 [Thermoanaerobacterium thermosaccharolyticum M0795]